MKWFRLTLGIGIVVLYWVSISWPSEKTRVVFCDVGQGDASLVMVGSLQILIDVGPGNGRVVECLAKYVPFYDKQIEVVVNTHPQSDHLGGMNDVMDHYDVGEFLTTGESPSSERMKKILDRLRSEGVQMTTIRSGDVIRYGDISFDILWPSHFEDKTVAGVSSGGNEHSVVLLMHTKSMTVLFTGDIGENEELALVGMKVLNKVDVLKVPHHGSKYSSTETFVSALRPKWAVVSVGAKNSYGHPAPDAMRRYDTVGSSVLRTDNIGNIEFNADEKSYWLVR